MKKEEKKIEMLWAKSGENWLSSLVIMEWTGCRLQAMNQLIKIKSRINDWDTEWCRVNGINIVSKEMNNLFERNEYQARQSICVYSIF